MESMNRMVKVQVKPNEPLDKALRRLRRICNNEGVTRELKRAAFYEKPSERRRRKERERLKTIRLSHRKE
jgi:small subunit ribosomal protein S21